MTTPQESLLLSNPPFSSLNEESIKLNLTTEHIVLFLDLDDTHNHSYIENICKEAISQNVMIYLSDSNIQKNDNIIELFESNDVIFNALMESHMDILKEDDALDRLKSAIGIFYFSKRKSALLNAHMAELSSYHRFFLYHVTEKSKALINVLKRMANDKYQHKGDKFYAHYQLLEECQEENTFEKTEMKEEVKEEVKEGGIKRENESSSSMSPGFPLKNIVIEKVKELCEEEEPKHILCTYYCITEDSTTNDLQLYCIIENAKNPLFTHIALYVESNEVYEILRTQMKNHLDETILQKFVCMINPRKRGEFFFSTIFEKMNSMYPNHILYLTRSDICIPNQPLMKNIQSHFIEDKRIYAISRIEKRLNQTVFKDPQLTQLFYGSSQDMYIVKLPLQIPMEGIDRYDFYKKCDMLKFNKIAEYYQYDMINDNIQCKIFRMVPHNDHNVRAIIQDQSEAIDYGSSEYSYVPELEGIQHMSLQKLIQGVCITKEDEYLVKKFIYNRFLIRKLFS